MMRIWHWVERILGVVAMLALFALVALPVLQVVLRGVFNNPIIGLEESTRWGLIILVFLAVPLLISNNEHIRLAEFVDLLPKRLRLALERLILIVSGVMLMVIAWSGVLSIWRNFGTRTPILDIPFWLFAAPMLLGFAIAAAGYLLMGLRRTDPPVGGAAPTI
jgi:TRAP-type C4-dicarboxylate transport system permease small subunit